MLPCIARSRIASGRLRFHIAGFGPTPARYRHASGLVYTEGVKYLAQTCDLEWMLGAVGASGVERWYVVPDPSGYVLTEEATAPVMARLILRKGVLSLEGECA